MSSRQAVIGICCALWTIGVAGCLVMIDQRPEFHLRHPAVTASAAMTVAWMLVAWLAMPCGWPSARLAWTLGWLMLLVHFAIAFGVAHSWSHAAAVEHVREVGGSGAGIAVNYLFALVWGADAAWWWVNATSRANRPRWVAFTVHGFLLFVVLNATVVFGPPGRRWVYAAALAGLVVVWWRNRR
jgi:hypothetical protein